VFENRSVFACTVKNILTWWHTGFLPTSWFFMKGSIDDWNYCISPTRLLQFFALQYMIIELTYLFVNMFPGCVRTPLPWHRVVCDSYPRWSSMFVGCLLLHQSVSVHAEPSLCKVFNNNKFTNYKLLMYSLLTFSITMHKL